MILHFTPRETDILNLAAHAFSRKKMESTLGKSIHTIDLHLRNLYKKTQTQSINELTAFAIHHGYGLIQQTDANDHTTNHNST